METVSLTAYAIATIRAMEQERPPAERLFEDRIASIFARDGADAAEGTKRFLELPFLVDAIRMRTRFNDELVESAVRSGLRQVVLMGAGFDSRAQRLPALAAEGVRVYEIDLPALVTRKGALLEAAGVATPNVVRIASDFSDAAFGGKLAADLAAAGFRAGAGAVFVWEGVVAYLGRDAVERTLRFMAAQGGPGSRLVFESAPAAFEPETAEDAVRAAGFSSAEVTSFATLWKQWLGGTPHENAAIVQAVVARIDGAALS